MRQKPNLMTSLLWVIGTTHFINAVVEQDARRLRQVAVIRLSKSFLREVPPFSEFPDGLTPIIKRYVGYMDGGLHIDGSEEAPVKEEQVVRECKTIKKLGLTAIVIAGVYSPIDEIFQQENKVRDIVLREWPGLTSSALMRSPTLVSSSVKTQAFSMPRFSSMERPSCEVSNER
jgi:N-methylhydantoinase A/oxoprolinase/acetone carboxylase beta subunit